MRPKKQCFVEKDNLNPTHAKGIFGLKMSCLSVGSPEGGSGLQDHFVSGQARLLGTKMTPRWATLANLGGTLAHLGARLAHLGARLALVGTRLAHLGASLAYLGG